MSVPTAIRNSRLYREEDTIFQFLTPGMLTKINDLRKSARSIFIIATNYASRIDSAIKRTGRIDQHFLLMLPDLGKRKNIIDNVLKEKANALTEAPGYQQKLEELGKISLYLGYSDIVGAVKRNLNSLDEIEAALNSTPASVTPDDYIRRLGQESFPTDEFLRITALAREAGREGRVCTILKKVREEEPLFKELEEAIDGFSNTSKLSKLEWANKTVGWVRKTLGINNGAS